MLAFEKMVLSSFFLAGIFFRHCRREVAVAVVVFDDDGGGDGGGDSGGSSGTAISLAGS